MFKKITVGYVVQNFDENGNFISQEFIAGDDCAIENEIGETVETEKELYFPFEMVQQ